MLAKLALAAAMIAVASWGVHAGAECHESPIDIQNTQGVRHRHESSKVRFK